jgi:hypothetical protein
MSCLEGSDGQPVRCRFCTAPWDGSSLVLGTMYSYDIFAAMPCCSERLKVSPEFVIRSISTSPEPSDPSAHEYRTYHVANWLHDRPFREIPQSLLFYLCVSFFIVVSYFCLR